MSKIKTGGAGSVPSVINHSVTIDGDLTVKDNLYLGDASTDKLQLGTATTDCGTMLMIKGAQTGDPQVEFALSADANGNFSITADTGDITLIAADDMFLSVDGNIELSLNGTELYPETSDGLALGTGSKMFSDLFLASAGVINFNNSNYTITHSAGLLTTNGALTIVGGLAGVTTLGMAGALSGVTTIVATGRISTTVGAAEALRLSTNADDYTGFTMDANGGLTIQSVDAAAAAANIAITADGTFAVTSTGFNLTGAGAVTGVTSLTTSGGRISNVTAVAAATYDLLVTDYILDVTYTSTAAVTSLTLMTAQVVAGRIVIIKDSGGAAATNNITIDTEGAETIDGAATLVMNANYESVTLYCDGTNWFVI